MSNPIYDAVATLVANRHHIPGDAIRCLQDILFCAESAPYHAPEGFAMEPADYAEHDVAECENGNAQDPDQVAEWGRAGEPLTFLVAVQTWACCGHCQHEPGYVHRAPCGDCHDRAEYELP